jgi:hypothetical protein
VISENDDNDGFADVDEVLKTMKRKTRMMDEIRYYPDRNDLLDFSYDKVQQ